MLISGMRGLLSERRIQVVAKMCYAHQMTTVEEIEKAVSALAPDELARFQAWFEAFEAARLDEKIERDARAGKLDKMAEQALAELREGRARQL
jgi:hypothetical protein